MSAESKTNSHRLVYTSLMICLVLLGTVLFRIPVPMTQGYVHLGDTIIFMSVLILGKKQGAVSAALGSALADVLGGYAFWAPWTIVIKFAMAYVTGEIIDKAGSAVSHQHGYNGAVTASRIAAMSAGGIVMCAGYLAAERVMYGSWALAALSLPWNIGQFLTGIAVAAAAQPLYGHIEM